MNIQPRKTALLRPAAVPLVTVDPYFNLWSCADHLTDDWVRFWTGAKQSFTGLIRIDGTPYRFMGRACPSDPNNWFKDEPDALEQVDVRVFPTQSVYTFNNEIVRLKLTFTTPLLLDKPEIMSMPITYIDYEVVAKDSNLHEISIYFDASGEICSESESEPICWERSTLENGAVTMRMGTEKQPVLEQVGDGVAISWGYLHMSAFPDNQFKSSMTGVSERAVFTHNGTLSPDDNEEKFRARNVNLPILSFMKTFSVTEQQPHTDGFILAYDDVASIEYFGKHLKGYWTCVYDSFEAMLCFAYEKKSDLLAECDRFNKELESTARASGGEKFAQLCSLAYRQAIAAHKLVKDEQDGLLFLSKECHSNGCIGTVDITYPSAPLFLLYNVDFVKGMLTPVFHYANTDFWDRNYAPHDVGIYPKANGQVYGVEENTIQENSQMPVEECGNMLIMTALVCLFEDSAAFAKQHWCLLTQWADYLVSAGIVLENQLCTDDFAGHLEKNANLAIKGITGIALYAKLCEMQGLCEQHEHYFKIAKQYAAEWEALAVTADHTMLAFKSPDSWSLKYNLIWDVMLNLNLFSKEIPAKEVSYYKKKANTYGTPLDSRKPYSKVDWIVWAASLTDSQEDFETLIAPIWDYINETPCRVPFADWYGTTDRCNMMFQNRTVLGGIFIKQLKDRLKNK